MRRSCLRALTTLEGFGTLALSVNRGIASVKLIRLVRLERHSDVAASELRRLSAQLRTAHEAERKSLARELHDQVGQMLTGLRTPHVFTVPGDGMIESHGWT